MINHHSHLYCFYPNTQLLYVAPVKILSKKEQKRLEDEEFERVMNEMGSEKNAAAAETTEESKQSSQPET